MFLDFLLSTARLALKKMNSPEFPCGYCNATGRKKLSKSLLPTYNAIRRLKNPTCGEIAAALKDGMNYSTTFKRVKLLIQYGLVRKVGSNYGARFELSPSA
jgi:hypothetical protein